MSLPLTVIGGYLGAGKTTLLNRMLTGHHGRRIAVIVNDFGALNVDASLVTSHAGDTIALSNGCICCSASDGTGPAIASILARGDTFDHIVIEASGVAEPGKVARNAAAFRLPLDGVIVLADAEQLPDQVGNRYTGRAVIAQLRQADLVVLNKIDLAAPERLTEARSIVERHAPGATIVMTDHARLPAAVMFGARPVQKAGEDPAAGTPDVHHPEGYASGVIERAPMSRREFETMAEELSRGMIRAKGHVAITERPEVRHLYQQVGRRWTLVEDGAWDTREPSTRIVTIAVRATVPEN